MVFGSNAYGASTYGGLTALAAIAANIFVAEVIAMFDSLTISTDSVFIPVSETITIHDAITEQNSIIFSHTGEPVGTGMSDKF